MLILLFLNRSFRVGLKVRPLYLNFIFKVIFDLRKYLFDDLCKVIMYFLSGLVLLLYLEAVPACGLLESTLDGLQCLRARFTWTTTLASLYSLLSPHCAFIIQGLSRDAHLSLEDHLSVLLILDLLIPFLPVLDVKVLIQDVVEPLMILLDIPEGL